ncbi:UDP-N-acetylmuramate--L-alanine ligase [Patescibacteria group bacterium]|nr:UDP-N-acetylmuramate--L-alanine ligase [Patescibacteria group bacterium]
MTEWAHKRLKIYFTGIKGIAMAALAVYCKERGNRVSGSDRDEVFPSDQELSDHGILWRRGFDRKHISEEHPDLVIYTGAHGGRSNPEVNEAIAEGIPVLSHAQALGQYMSGATQISVAGSHGKTTTSAMIATILVGAGLDPSYAIGCGNIRPIGAAGHYGKGVCFVAEADEYVTDPGHDRTPRFLWQRPDVLVVTNIDYDHPDAYGSVHDVIRAFRKLRDRMPKDGTLIVSADDRWSASLGGKTISAVSVGKKPGATYRIQEVRFSRGKTSFRLLGKGKAAGRYRIAVPGMHNVTNAALAAVATERCGVGKRKIREGLGRFGGTLRRFELLAHRGSFWMYDDYAHHPREIAATLRGARNWFPGQHIIAVFQPHTYSRTAALLDGFARSFKDADEVIITDIYASAREKKQRGVSGRQLYRQTALYHHRVRYGEAPEDVENYLFSTDLHHTVVICMGAGDIYVWSRAIASRLVYGQKRVKRGIL